MSTKKNAKNSVGKKILVWVVAIAIIAAIVALTIFNYSVDSGLISKNLVAMETENFSLTIPEMEYFYRSVSASYMSMFQSYGMSDYIDTSVSHKQQQSQFGNGTWFDYFLDQSVTQATEILTCCEAAKAEGITLDDDDYALVDKEIESMTATAESLGVSLKKYLSNYYGSSVTEKNVRNVIELQVLSHKYVDAHVDAADISEETLSAMYADNVSNYDVVNYLTFSFDYNDIYLDEEEKKKAETASTDTTASTDDPAETDADTTADTETETETAAPSEEPTEVVTEDKAEAQKLSKEYADKLVSALEASDKAELEETFRAYIKDYSMNVLGLTEEEYEKNKDNIESGNIKYTKGNEIREWAFDDTRAVGDFKVFEETETHDHKEGDDHSELGTVYTVVVLTKTEGPDEAVTTADVRHILFSKDDYKDDAKVKEVYDKWVADGAKVEDFTTLAAEYSADESNKDEGGLMEDLTKGSTVTEFDEWVFAEDRKAGDHAIVKTENYGWHIVFYEAEGYAGWEKTIVDEIQSKATTEATKAAAEAYSVTQNTDDMVKYINA